MSSVIIKLIFKRISTILPVLLKQSNHIKIPISKLGFNIQGLSSFESNTKVNAKSLKCMLPSHSCQKFKKSNLLKRLHSTDNDHQTGELITVTFITKDGKRHTVKGKEGENALFLAQRNEIEMEGACEASLACTTCHVYVNEEFIDQLPPAEEKEEDLLDMAPFLKPNSRLGCQIILTKEIDGIELTLPKATRNFYVDGHKPQPH